MSPLHSKPIIHGRDHLPGGPDPIPGFFVTGGSYQERILAEPSLIGYWPLDEEAEPAVDRSTHGNDLTEEGGVAPTWGEPGPFAEDPAATSVLFDTASGTSSSTDELTDIAAADAELNEIGSLLQPFTFEILAYPTEFEPADEGGIMGVYGYPSGDAGGIYLLVEEAGDEGKVSIVRAGETYTSPVALSLDEWVHLAATYDGETVRLYFDGEQQLAEATSASHGPSGFLRIGTFRSGEVGGLRRQNFHGRLAQAAIYNEALSASTIAQHASSVTTVSGVSLTAPITIRNYAEEDLFRIDSDGTIHGKTSVGAISWDL